MQAKKRILFLFSDTGGGHRSSCEAVEEAFDEKYPNQLEITKIDFFKYYSPWPFSSSANLYPHMVKLHSRPWEISFNFSNHPKTFLSLSDFLWPYIKPKIEKLFVDHPSDFIVSFHPLINNYLRHLDKVFAVVITDLVTAHYAWYSGNPVRYFVPTQEIKDTGIEFGVDPKKIEITGLPVSLHFHPKKNLDTKPKVLNILLMGGGQGLGRIYQIATALNQSDLSIKLTVIAGRNLHLEKKLRQTKWRMPIKIYGFTKDIPTLMRQSDILLTKAGPSTICEGLVTGIPIILYDYLKGQETASVDYLIKNHAGFYCPDPEKIISTIRSIKVADFATNIKTIARPSASKKIADNLYKLIS